MKLTLGGFETSSYVIVLLLCLSFLSGCKPPTPQGGVGGVGVLDFKEFQPEAGIGEASLSYLHWYGADGWKGLALVVLSDVTGASGFSGTQGHHTASDGRRIEWQVKWTGDKTGSINMNGQEFDLAEGNLFVVSARDADVRVRQLNRQLWRLKEEVLTTEEIVELIHSDKDVGQFFANSAESPSAP